MADCKYCTNYYLNSHERLDNACMGHGDCRRKYFYCNQRLKPSIPIEDETEKIIEEPQSEVITNKTIVDYLKDNDKFIQEIPMYNPDLSAFDHYKITLYTLENYNWSTLQFDAPVIIMEIDSHEGDKHCMNKHEIKIENNNPQYDIQDILYEEYGVEIRFCDKCGKPYDAGYMAGDGEWYSCEECFESVMDGYFGKGKWQPSEEEGRYGGYYEYLNDDGEWEDTGAFYTEWN